MARIDELFSSSLLVSVGDDYRDDMIHTLRRLINNLKLLDDNNEFIKEENVLFKGNNQEMIVKLEKTSCRLTRLMKLEEEMLNLRLTHEYLFTEISCRVAECIEVNEELNKLKISEDEKGLKIHYLENKHNYFDKSSRQLQEMLKQQRPGRDHSGLGYYSCSLLSQLYSPENYMENYICKGTWNIPIKF